MRYQQWRAKRGLEEDGTAVPSGDCWMGKNKAAPLQITPVIDRPVSGQNGRGPVNVSLSLNIPTGAPITRNLIHGDDRRGNRGRSRSICPTTNIALRTGVMR